MLEIHLKLNCIVVQLVEENFKHAWVCTQKHGNIWIFLVGHFAVWKIGNAIVSA